MSKALVFFVLFLSVFLFISLDEDKVLTSSLLDGNTTTIEKQSPERLERENKVVSVTSDKTIYLTFDDGPSYLTTQVLDILEEKEVPATFFVVGTNLEKYQNVVQRAYIDGHTIALHSDTHVYQNIYVSLEAYLNDLQSLRQKVYKITKEYPRIVRLPGGVSNTISIKYKEGVMTEITSWLDTHDYYYFDWNIDSYDATENATKDFIYQNVINNLNDGDNIVLMHDASTKQTTVQALPLIIDYAKEQGYTFARITKNTNQYHHKIKN